MHLVLFGFARVPTRFFDLTQQLLQVRSLEQAIPVDRISVHRDLAIPPPIAKRVRGYGQEQRCLLDGQVGVEFLHNDSPIAKATRLLALDQPYQTVHAANSCRVDFGKIGSLARSEKEMAAGCSCFRRLATSRDDQQFGRR